MTTDQTTETTAAPVVVDDFDAMVNDAEAHAREAKAVKPTAKRVTYTGKVRDALDADPAIEQAALIRKVLSAMDVQSSGLDAMTDDELLQVVMVGSRVLDVRKAMAKAAANSNGQ